MLADIDRDLRGALVSTAAAFSAAVTDEEQTDQRTIIGIIIDGVLRRHQWLDAKVRESKQNEQLAFDTNERKTQPMTTIKLMAPADFSATEIHCNAVGQSGNIYRHITGGAVIDVDTRDVPAMLQNGFNYTVMTLAALS